mgnify:CR=1 FL=1
MIKPTAVAPEQVVAEEEGLLVYLPAPVNRQSNRPLRLVFATEVFDLATTFQGEVLNRAGVGLPQLVVDGDVSQELSSNSLRVLGTTGETPDLLQQLTLSTPTFTPNGDGANDRAAVAFEVVTIVGQAQLDAAVFELAGRRVRSLLKGPVANGIYDSARVVGLAWDGRDAEDGLVPPGVYVVRVQLKADARDTGAARAVGVAY